jgi:primosomal protein N'
MDEWRECLQEASLSHLGESLRRLFALILTHCSPSQPNLLWVQFRDHLCDDLPVRLQRKRNARAEIQDEEIYDYGLFLIDNDLRLNGTSLSSFPSMPHFQRDWEDEHANPYVEEQLRFWPEEERRLSDSDIPMLNAEQCSAFDKIFTSTSAQEGKTFFLHGPGGTGKTFLYNTLCHRVRANGWIALCVASSGIAQHTVLLGALLSSSGRLSTNSPCCRQRISRGHHPGNTAALNNLE